MNRIKNITISLKIQEELIVFDVYDDINLVK